MWFCVCRWTQTTFGYVTLVQQVNVQSLVKIMFRPNLENDDFKKWIEKNSLPQDRTQREVSPA